MNAIISQHIARYEGFLSTKQCSEVIEEFELRQPEHKKGPTNGYCLARGTYFYTYLRRNPLEYSFSRKLVGTILNYSKKYFALGNLPLGWSDAAYCLTKKYDVGNHYSIEHCEIDGLLNGHSQRVLAWMIYLNTIEKDGGTFFPQQEFTADAIAGDLLIWPAGWTHSHYGIKAETSEKYIISGWVEFVEESKSFKCNQSRFD